MFRIEIVSGSLQVSFNGSVILVAPKESCAIDVLTLYLNVPFITIYNKYLGTTTTIFSKPLSECEDDTGTPFTVSSFIAFSEANLGFYASSTSELDENLWAVKNAYLGLMLIPTILTSAIISSSANNTNNRVILLPFSVGKIATIDRVAIINNAENDGVNSTVTFYIYDNSNSGLAGIKLFQEVSSTGALIGSQKVIELSVNWTIPRGNYYIGYHIRGLNTSGTNPTFIGGVLTLNSANIGSLVYTNNQNTVLAVNNQSQDLGDNPIVVNSSGATVSFPQIFVKLS